MTDNHDNSPATTAGNSTASGICYRGYALELSPGRFSRDNWRTEHYELPVPKASRPPRRKSVRAVPLPRQRNVGGRPKGQSKHQEAMMPLTRGFYERVRMWRDDLGRLMIAARCTGVRCGGTGTRKFHAGEWVSTGPDGKRCRQCSWPEKGTQKQAPPTLPSAQPIHEAGQVNG